MNGLMALGSILAILGVVLLAGYIIAVMINMFSGAFNHEEKSSRKNVDTMDYSEYKALNNQTEKTQDNIFDLDSIKKAKAEEKLAKSKADKFDDFKIDDIDEDLDSIEAKLAKNKQNDEIKSYFDKKISKNTKEQDKSADDDLDAMLSEISNDIIDEVKENKQEENNVDSNILDKYDIDDIMNNISKAETTKSVEQAEPQVERNDKAQYDSQSVQDVTDELRRLMQEFKDATVEPKKTMEEFKSVVNESKKLAEELRAEKMANRAMVTADAQKMEEDDDLNIDDDFDNADDIDVDIDDYEDDFVEEDENIDEVLNDVLKETKTRTNKEDNNFEITPSNPRQLVYDPVRTELNDANKEIENLKAQLRGLNAELDEARNLKASSGFDMTEDECVERINMLEERLKSLRKDYKTNLREYKPLKKVRNDLSKYQTKLRRREAVAAKKKVALYGVNNYVDIDKEKAEKLAEELELLDGLRLSVQHCEEVIESSNDRFPILENTHNILSEQIAMNEADLNNLQEILKKIRDKKDGGNK